MFVFDIMQTIEPTTIFNQP